MGLLYGRAGRLTAQNGGFRPGQSPSGRGPSKLSRRRRQHALSTAEENSDLGHSAFHDGRRFWSSAGAHDWPDTPADGTAAAGPATRARAPWGAVSPTINSPATTQASSPVPEDSQAGGDLSPSESAEAPSTSGESADALSPEVCRRTFRAALGRLSTLSVPQRFPMKTHFVWGFCMSAQGA
jgi:hypothetical protein